jgi:hypothetical protein
MAINNPRLVQVVGGHFHVDFVAHGDTDEIFPHFAGDMGEHFMPVRKRHPEHRARQDLGHISHHFDWLFFRHKIVEPFIFMISMGKIKFFPIKKRLDKCRRSATLPPTMKSEALNTVLTFILGVLVVLGVVFALRVFFVTRDSRQLQGQALMANSRLVQARQLVTAVAAYNQKAQSPDLTRILQSLQPPSHQ